MQTTTPAAKPFVMNVRVQTMQGEAACELEVPDETMRLADLARLAARIAQAGAEHAAEAGAARDHCVTCTRGCAACCRQLVCVSPAEAWMLAEVTEAQPEPERARLDERCKAAERHLDAAGLSERLETLMRAGDAWSDEEHHALAADYFRAQVDCPFLERDGACGIYAGRPALCREYLVTSPAEDCAQPFSRAVARVPNAVRAGEALGALSVQKLPGAPRMIPIALAVAWARKQKNEGKIGYDARALIDLFLRHLDLAIVAHESEAEVAGEQL